MRLDFHGIVFFRGLQQIGSLGKFKNLQRLWLNQNKVIKSFKSRMIDIVFFLKEIKDFFVFALAYANL